MNKYEALKIRQILDNPDLSNNERMWEVSLLVDEALEQPAQDYVFICKRCGDDLGIEYVPDEQPAQEPVGVVSWHGGAVMGSIFPSSNMPKDEDKLYTHPHQWQGLTDNEKLASIRKWAENNTMRGQELIGLCDAIEQALKEKNKC